MNPFLLDFILSLREETDLEDPKFDHGDLTRRSQGFDH